MAGHLCFDLGKKIPGTWPGELNREVSRLGDVGSKETPQRIALMSSVITPMAFLLPVLF